MPALDISPIDGGLMGTASRAVSGAWDVSVGMAVAIGGCFFLGFILLICLRVIFGDRKNDRARQDKDTASRIMLATAVSELSTLMRSFKCLKD